MSSAKQVRWGPAPSGRERFLRQMSAGLLERASGLLARLASGLVLEQPRDAMDPRVEFYAEAGAPEGALFVDGRFVGWLEGVTRL